MSRIEEIRNRAKWATEEDVLTLLSALDTANQRNKELRRILAEHQKVCRGWFGDVDWLSRAGGKE